MGFLAGKRESRRYVGDYTLTQNDIENCSAFDDEVAYGGWSMDDHDPRGLYAAGAPNIQHPVKAPYAIPYRCLYSANIENLFFAGRNISVTHMALSSTRVMATCAIVGQAVGTACALAHAKKISPRGVGEYIGALQQMLRDDDCYLLRTPRRISDAVRRARFDLPLSLEYFDGTERNIGKEDRAISLSVGEPFAVRFEKEIFCRSIRILFDNDIAGERYKKSEWYLKQYPNRNNIPKDAPRASMPPALAKVFRVYVYRRGKKELAFQTADNWSRMVKIPVNGGIEGMELICDAACGAEKVRLFSFDICE